MISRWYKDGRLEMPPGHEAGSASAVSAVVAILQYTVVSMSYTIYDVIMASYTFNDFYPRSHIKPILILAQVSSYTDMIQMVVFVYILFIT